MLTHQEPDDSTIPTSVPLSSDHISDDGIYLLENSIDCLIYVGNSVQQNVLKKLFGISSAEEISNQVVFHMLDDWLFISEYAYYIFKAVVFFHIRI